MKRHNILYLANTGDIIGGGEISLLGLLETLDRSKYSPLVVCPSEGELAGEVRKLGIEVLLVPMGSLKFLNPFRFELSVRQLKKMIWQREIDLVHANGSRCAVYGGLACRLAKVPMIWHVRILESDGLLDRGLAGLASMIITNSDAVKGRFKWMRDRSRVETVYNGIDLEKFGALPRNDDIRRELGVPLEAPLVGTVGRLDWYKAQQYFIQAAKQIKDAVLGTKFLVVGEGAKRAGLEALAAELGLREDVVFAGHRHDIPEIMAALDVFALSSVSEGFGRAAVEAMACGKPVVATRVGGLPEIVEDGVSGRLVPPADSTALAAAITGLLKDKAQAAAMGAAGRKRAENFSLARSAEKTQEVYDRVLRGRRGDERI